MRAGRAIVALVGTAFALVAFLLVGALFPNSSRADLDCSNFSNQAAAQEAFIAAGGPADDPNNLDADNDGVACESLPCPCSGMIEPPPAPPPAAPDPPSMPPSIYWKSFQMPAEVEPRKITIGTGAGSPLYLSHLNTWQGWGSGRASAIGKLRINTCRPYCAAGRFTTRRARVILAKVRSECGERRYMNVKVRIFGFRLQVLGPWGSDCRGAQVRRP